VRAWASQAVPLLASLALGACAAPSSYMGISLEPGAAASDLQDLARRAQAGDKQAQLDLGITYEEGRGVGVDLKRAERLFRIAARPSHQRLIAVLPMANGAGPSVLAVPSSETVYGLEQAGVRLARISRKINKEKGK
jgi:TPR repeat protein